jgi:glycosyltransferase involved in cell wall biosynthesis
MLYPGGLQWHQGLDIAIRAFSLLEHEMPDLEFHIYGEGNEEHSLRAEIEMLHLDGRVKIFPPVPIRRVAELMASSDVGIVAKRAESFGNEAYSTKILEYMTQDLPVVASRTAIDTYYFTDNEVCFFKSGDAADMARAIRDVLTDKGLRERLVHNAREAVAKNTWQANERAYLDLVDKLVAEKR